MLLKLNFHFFTENAVKLYEKLLVLLSLSKIAEKLRDLFLNLLRFFLLYVISD